MIVIVYTSLNYLTMARLIFRRGLKTWSKISKLTFPCFYFNNKFWTLKTPRDLWVTQTRNTMFRNQHHLYFISFWGWFDFNFWFKPWIWLFIFLKSQFIHCKQQNWLNILHRHESRCQQAARKLKNDKAGGRKWTYETEGTFCKLLQQHCR